MSTFRFSVAVMPRDGILDPQGRAVETSLPHLGVDTVHGVRVGRRVELGVDAPDERAAYTIVERLAHELLANPLIETYAIERLADADRPRDDAGDPPEAAGDQPAAVGATGGAG